MVDTDEQVEFFPPRRHVGISRHALGSPPGKDKNNCGRGREDERNVRKKMYVKLEDASEARARNERVHPISKRREHLVPEESLE